jgi:hypothetical protein
MVCGGYAYYLTHTIFDAYSTSGRELRSADTVSGKHFAEAAKLFGQKVLVVKTPDKYTRWLYLGGWAIVTVSFARDHMQQWLKKAECIKASTNIFTDVEIVSPSALRHYTSQGRKKHVLSRDKGSCLVCNATEDDGVKLTMQHVRPFSRGGETTAQNLVTLCESCNQIYGIEEVTELYNKAGLHFGYDPSIIKGIPTAKARYKAVELSDNLMQTRCEIW